MDEPDRNARKEGANQEGLAEMPFSRRALLAGGLLPFTLGGMDSERTVAEQLMARRAPMPRDVGIIDAVIDGRDHEYDKDGNRWNPGANKLYNDQRYYYKINPDPLPYISGGKYYYGASFKNSVLELPHGSSMKWIAEKIYYWSTSPIGESDFRNDVPPSKISTPPLHMVARTGQDWNESITPSRPSPSNPASQIAPTNGWGTIFGEGDVYVSTWTDQYRVLNYDGWYKTIRLRFPVYQPVSLHVYSGALGYFDFPVRNGRYRIRSVGTKEKLGEERYLMLGGTGGNPNYVTNVRVPVTTWGPLAASAMPNADWFVCSSSGTQYTMTPVQSLSCVLNNSYGKVDNAAQAFRLDWNDAADLMLIERLPNGNYTIRCKMTGAYLTANCLANSNGATCMFRSRRPGDTAQEWNLIPVDERYYTREQVRAALDSSSGQKPTFATTNSNHATNGNRIYCPTFTATKEHNKGVLSADKPGALPVGRDGIAVDRIQCDVGAYLLTQTAALPSHDMIDQRGVVGFQPYREFATRICLVNQPKGGKAPIHLMLLDENGNVREVGFAGLLPGEVLRPGDAVFAEAQATIAGAYTDRIAELVDRWYVGKAYAEPGNFAQGNKLGDDGYVVHGPTYVWGRIKKAAFRFYADGADDEAIVYRVNNIPLGSEFRIPAEALRAAVRPRCNLNDHFGEEASTGFTGWFWDPELTRPFADGEAFYPDEPITYRLYGRNRATVRAAYAEDSARPEPGADYRVAPEDDAPAYPHALEIPDLSGEPVHTVQGPDGRDMDLPPIGDNGPDHLAAYVGERVELPAPRTVFRRMGDGRWRTYRCTGWSEDPAPRAAAADGAPFRSARKAGAGAGSLRLERDTVRYVRWEETVVDGVVTR